MTYIPGWLYTKFIITAYDINVKQGASLGSPSSGAWPTINKAFYYQFTVDVSTTIYSMWVANGSTASGNFDIGVYSADGTKLTSSGFTKQSGTSTTQFISLVAPLTIGPGAYYIGLAMDNTTGTFVRVLFTGTGHVLAGSYIQTSAFPLPANATFASANAESNLVLCGLWCDLPDRSIAPQDNTYVNERLTLYIPSGTDKNIVINDNVSTSENITIIIA